MTIKSNKAAPDTGKASATPDAKKNTLTTKDHEGKPMERVIAELGLSSMLSNANTARTYAKATFGEIDVTESVRVMREKASAVQAGNLAELEATLIAQAVALDAIFNELAGRAALNMGEYLNATEIYLRLGLKAQAVPGDTANAG